MLTLDRKYAKEILNSAGMPQAVTDRDRAQIALTYRCASLTDVFWVRKKGEMTTYEDVNLYDNHLDQIFMDIALCGRQYTVENRYLASRVSRCFDVAQVLYEEDYFDGEKVTVSDHMTSKEYSIAPMEAYEIFLKNQDKDIKTSILALDQYNYHMMNIVDYLVGNTDRHWGNWGVLVDNSKNRPIGLHKLMDFNQAFHAYDRIEGANCQTAFRSGVTQAEAAIVAVKEVGLNQMKEVKQEVFADLPQYYEMFCQRLELLRAAEG